MIDLFEIINSRRDNRIKITGIVSELSVIPYTTKDINSLVSILLDKRDELDIKIFDIHQEDASVSRRPLSIADTYERRRPLSITDTYERLPIEAITFDIDVYMNAELYNNICSEFEDLIDYFTTGAIKYDVVEEAMSGLSIARTARSDFPEPYVTVNWEDLYDTRRNPLGDSTLYEFQEYNFFGMGSYPRHHDADGDILSFMEFEQDFRPTDMSNMFSNMVLSLDELSRPVIDRRDR